MFHVGLIDFMEIQKDFLFKKKAMPGMTFKKHSVE